MRASFVNSLWGSRAIFAWSSLTMHLPSLPRSFSGSPLSMTSFNPKSSLRCRLSHMYLSMFFAVRSGSLMLLYKQIV